MHTLTDAPGRPAWFRLIPGIAREDSPQATRVVYDEWLHGSQVIAEGKSTVTPTSFRFGAGGVKALTLHPTSTLHLTCVYGTLWVTRDGDAVDHVLAAGESVNVPSDVSAVVQALSQGLLRVTSASSSIA